MTSMCCHGPVLGFSISLDSNFTAPLVPAPHPCACVPSVWVFREVGAFSSARLLCAQVCDKYLALARAVLDGEKALLASLAETIAAATPVLLREPVLRRAVAVNGEQASITVNYSPALLEARYTPP